jgi:hypothetical protein
MNGKYLTPWQRYTYSPERLAIYKLGENKPLVELIPQMFAEKSGCYSTNGLYGTEIKLNKSDSVGDIHSFVFSSLGLAITKVNKILEDNGYIILTEEQYDKLQVLL